MGEVIRIIGAALLFSLLSGAGALAFTRQAARSWDLIAPGTRPTRGQAADWGRDRARSAASAARAAAVRARPPGFRNMRVRGVVLNDPPAPAPAGPGASPPRPPAPAPAGTPGRPADASPPAGSPPGRIVTGAIVTPPAATAPGTAVPSSATGRTTPVTIPAVASLSATADDTAAAYARTGAVAVTGNINDKIDAFAALSESFEAGGNVLRAIARSMEEDSLYGPEITEPAHALANIMLAAARAAAETEEQLRSLANTPVGEVPASRHQAPARSELMESGR